MEETRVYYDEKSKNYEETFSILYFRVFDAIPWKHLEPYLPTNPNALILDAGGGPGRYTIELAKMGYDVILFDYTPELLKFAKKKISYYKVKDKIKNIIEGSITDLSLFDDYHFDSVICLGGPLSHIKGESNRNKAVSELVRVTKKDAPIFI